MVGVLEIGGVAMTTCSQNLYQPEAIRYADIATTQCALGGNTTWSGDTARHSRQLVLKECTGALMLS